jgi:hypothetical protein
MVFDWSPFCGYLKPEKSVSSCPLSTRFLKKCPMWDRLYLSWGDPDTPLKTDHTFTILSPPSSGTLQSYN